MDHDSTAQTLQASPHRREYCGTQNLRLVQICELLPKRNENGNRNQKPKQEAKQKPKQEAKQKPKQEAKRERKQEAAKLCQIEMLKSTQKKKGGCPPKFFLLAVFKIVRSMRGAAVASWNVVDRCELIL